MDSEYVCNVSLKNIDAKPYAKSNENTAMLEVIATVILRCFDKNTVEELYLVNLLHFNEPDVGLWKGVKADWAMALREALPKFWTNTRDYSGTSCFLITMAAR